MLYVLAPNGHKYPEEKIKTFGRYRMSFMLPVILKCFKMRQEMKDSLNSRNVATI